MFLAEWIIPTLKDYERNIVTIENIFNFLWTMGLGNDNGERKIKQHGKAGEKHKDTKTQRREQILCVFVFFYPPLWVRLINSDDHIVGSCKFRITDS